MIEIDYELSAALTNARRRRRKGGAKRNRLIHSENLSQWGRTSGGVASAPTVNVIGGTAFQTLPDGGNGSTAGKGFTCTGLFHESGSLWVGNIGMDLPAGSPQSPQIIRVSLNGATLEEAITVAQQPQGVVALGDYLYYAQPTQGKVYRILRNGTGEEEFTTLALANGLATNGGQFWVSSGFNVYPLSLDGTLGTPFSVGVDVDHLYYDAARSWLWITSGANGVAGSMSIYSFNEGRVLRTYTLTEGLALEGITVVGSSILTVSDGYYHSAEVVPALREVNELQTYPLYPVTGGIVGNDIADYVRFALNGGVLSADFSQIQQTSAVAGARVGSVYMWTADGSAKNIALNIADSGGNTQEIKALTGANTRFSTARATYANTPESMGIRLRGAAGTSDNAEVFIYAAQVEAGATPTAYQKTGATL